MSPSLRALLDQVVDYAGLFPPAQLPFDQALANYVRYRDLPDAWMLGRFVCPAARLAEVAPFRDQLQGGPPFDCVVLGRGGTSEEDFQTGLRADLDAIAAFRKEFGERVTVDALDMRLPEPVCSPEDTGPLRAFLHTIDELVRNNLQPVPTLYFEAPPTAQWRKTTFTILAALTGDDHGLATSGRRLHGFKLRCGGADAKAIPSAEQVAFTLRSCRDFEVPLKFTAGLHHPIRHRDVGLAALVHGFINVFVAEVLAHVRRLRLDQVRAIVEDEAAGNFTFEASELRWKDLAASVNEIEAVRGRAVVSFGSCDFEEPRADLRDLGWLPR